MISDARLAATEVYMAAEAKLRRKASKAAKTGRLATAEDFRHLAEMVHHAAVAEEQDPPVRIDR